MMESEEFALKSAAFCLVWLGHYVADSSDLKLNKITAFFLMNDYIDSKRSYSLFLSICITYSQTVSTSSHHIVSQ